MAIRKVGSHSRLAICSEVLKALRIRGRIAPLPHPLNPISHTLAKCTFQLHTFEWEFDGTDELLISVFLRKQHGITDLSFIRGWNLAKESRTALRGLCRQLESVCTNMSIASTIVSRTDRPSLKCLRCTDFDLSHGFRDVDPVSTADLPSKFGGVRVLHYDYNVLLVRPSLFDVANSLQKVTLLRFQIESLRDIGQEVCYFVRFANKRGTDRDGQSLE